MRSWWRGRKGLGDPLLHNVSEWVQGAVGPSMGSRDMDQGAFLPLPSHIGTCRLGRSPLAACCFWT